VSAGLIRQRRSPALLRISAAVAIAVAAAAMAFAVACSAVAFAAARCVVIIRRRSLRSPDAVFGRRRSRTLSVAATIAITVAIAPA